VHATVTANSRYSQLNRTELKGFHCNISWVTYNQPPLGQPAYFVGAKFYCPYALADGNQCIRIKSKLKVRYTDIAVCSLTCHTITGTHVPYRITQCYLPPDRGDIPAFTPAKAGTRISDPEGMQGWVDLDGLLHTEMVYHTRPKTVTHPSTNRARRALTLFKWWTLLTTMPRHQP